MAPSKTRKGKRAISNSKEKANCCRPLKADEFKYLLNYQVLLDEVVIKKYALYTTLDFAGQFVAPPFFVHSKRSEQCKPINFQHLVTC
ncbi:hypothetical protein V1525DRAFT_408310 [Lipomyces kononenkoae]|uniref:Uncharacterized protein n=1 Tax=Lipomyces kononenkoae TaxID=34357 RepID=A0ACC3SWE5_LIPKO